jgi:hypothetical protein
MREQREVLRRLGIGDEPPLPPSPLQLPSPPPAREKTRRGRPVVLTNDEIAAGVTIVRRENWRGHDHQRRGRGSVAAGPRGRHRREPAVRRVTAYC